MHSLYRSFNGQRVPSLSFLVIMLWQWEVRFSCCFDVDLVFSDFGVEGIVAVMYVLICR